MFCFVRVVSSLRMSDPAVKRVVSDIIRSPEDKREYRGLEFTNGLKAVLISDPTTDKSSAALDVHIGNVSSPRPREFSLAGSVLHREYKQRLIHSLRVDLAMDTA